MWMNINNILTTKHVAVLVILLCILICISPLLRLLLPDPLRNVDTYHLARMITDWQKFAVDAEAIGGNNATITIKIDEKIINTHLLKIGDVPDKRKYENDSVIKYFMPAMSIKDRANTLCTLETFVRACEMGNLTYFLWGGSMLGAYRHQGFIPWDDDVDLVMNASEWRQIRNVLSRVQGYVLHAPGDHQWKFFKQDLPPTPGVGSYKWPFIDIFFFNEDSTHVWALTQSLKNELVVRKDDIFPVQLRLFESLLVAVPCEMEKLVLRTYGNDCLSLSFSHKMTRSLDPSWVKLIPCKRLYNIFPFVFRQKDPNTNNVIETLKRGDTVLRNISVSQSCKLEA